MEAADSSALRDRALVSLEGREVEGLVLHVEMGPVSAGGARYFELFLEEPGKDQARLFLEDQGKDRVPRPVLRGFYRVGREPAWNWVEVLRINPKEALPSPGGLPRVGADEAAARIEEALLKALADLVPAGGHMMVEYETRPETERALALGVPPPATPLGSLLRRVGCGTGFKDWYFTEGWTEGPRKLQGYKALNEEHSRRRARTTALELLDLLSKPHDPRQEDLLGPARRRAIEALRDIQAGDEELDRRIREAVAAELLPGT